MRRRLLVILVLGGIALALAAAFGPAADQRRTARRINAVTATEIRPRVEADGRFRDVTLHTTSHPLLAVRGRVADARALADLTRIVDPERRPFRVRMFVEVDEASAAPATGETEGSSPQPSPRSTGEREQEEGTASLICLAATACPPAARRSCCKPGSASTAAAAPG